MCGSEGMRSSAQMHCGINSSKGLFLIYCCSLLCVCDERVKMQLKQSDERSAEVRRKHPRTLVTDNRHWFTGEIHFTASVTASTPPTWATATSDPRPKSHGPRVKHTQSTSVRSTSPLAATAHTSISSSCVNEDVWHNNTHTGRYNKQIIQGD